MNSRKLSLPLIAEQIEHLADNAYTPNESWVIALKINLRAIAATLRDGDEHYCACPTPGAEPGHRCPNCELWVAALAQQAQPEIAQAEKDRRAKFIASLYANAPSSLPKQTTQQAQPLTDEMIVRKVEDWRGRRCRENKWEFDGAVNLLKWARDRMAQQAQPEDGAWMQVNCNSGGTGHYFMAYVRSGESLPYLCNAHTEPAQQAQPEMPTREMAEALRCVTDHKDESSRSSCETSPHMCTVDRDAVLALFAPKGTCDLQCDCTTVAECPKQQ